MTPELKSVYNLYKNEGREVSKTGIQGLTQQQVYIHVYSYVQSYRSYSLFM